MNKEEKQAIKELKNFKSDKDCKFWIGLNGEKAIDIIINLIEKQQDEIEELKLDLHEMTISNNHKKKYWVHKSILNSYIRKDKIKEIFDTKIYNCKYLSETDLSNELKVIDLRVADILKIILDELLGE